MRAAEPVELRENHGVGTHRRGKFGAAVHDAMGDRAELVLRAVRRVQPIENVGECAIVGELGFRLLALLADGLRHEVRWGVNGLHLAAGDGRERRGAMNNENLMLDEPALRTRIASIMRGPLRHSHRLVGS